ncbi:hypothetical protein HK097_009331, partial [Rhizophlyctis rosea]
IVDFVVDGDDASGLGGLRKGGGLGRSRGGTGGGGKGGGKIGDEEMAIRNPLSGLDTQAFKTGKEIARTPIKTSRPSSSPASSIPYRPYHHSHP